MNLRSIVLKVRGQTQKPQGYTVHLYYGPQKGETRPELRLVALGPELVELGLATKEPWRFGRVLKTSDVFIVAAA